MGSLTIIYPDGTTTVVRPGPAWSPGPGDRQLHTDGLPPSRVHFPEGVVVNENPHAATSSLPDQVKGWPPEKNKHGFNRAARRAAAKNEKKNRKASLKATESILNKLARKETPP